jgi:hypothetical protein
VFVTTLPTFGLGLLLFVVLVVLVVRASTIALFGRSSCSTRP